MELPRDETSLEKVLAALGRMSGLRVTRADQGLRLETASGVSHEVDLTWLPRIRESDTSDLVDPSHGSPRPRLYVTEVLDKGALRSAPGLGLQVAGPGSAHIDLPGLFLHVEGSRPPRPRVRDDAGARLLFALLQHDGGFLPVPELERTAGASFARLRRPLVALIRTDMVAIDGDLGPQKGFSERRSDRILHVHVRDRSALLRAWESRYVHELRSRLLLGEVVPIAFPDFRAWRTWLPDVAPDILRGGALGAAALGLLPDTAALHLSSWNAEDLAKCRVLPLPGGPIAVLSRIGSADAAPSNPELAHPLLVLGELAVQTDPRIRTIRDVLRKQLERPSEQTERRAAP